jgi:multidrug efflux pump subunit AcrA (membrane-fusion protein)
VALDPIWVNFNVNEQDVLRIREEARRPRDDGGRSPAIAVEVGLQTETGFPHKGRLDYAAVTLNQSTGTLPVRGVLPIPDRALAAGILCRVACRSIRSRTRCSCRTSRSAAIRPDAICWS